MRHALGRGNEPSATYSTGNGQFEPPVRDWSIAHSYMDYALLLDDLGMVVHASGRVEALSYELEQVENYEISPAISSQVLKEFSRSHNR